MSIRADEVFIIEGRTEFEPLHIKKPSGALLIEGVHVADTLTCCHCGYTWVPIKGSGKVRGFCLHCRKVTCGRPECDKCLPLEKQIELIERKK